MNDDKPTKIFYNALSYADEFGGWFICEPRNWPYKISQNWPFIPDPNQHEFSREIKEVHAQLRAEMMQVAADLKISSIDDPDLLEGELVLDEENGKKLTEALIALGWEKRFIAIGP